MRRAMNTLFFGTRNETELNNFVNFNEVKFWHEKNTVNLGSRIGTIVKVWKLKIIMRRANLSLFFLARIETELDNCITF